MSELYLKNEKVLTIKDIEGVPREIQKIDAPELLPVCLSKSCSMEQLNEWLQKRMIPETREGLSKIIKDYGKDWLNQKNYASLSDQYWLKKRRESWKKVNFFTNMYSHDIGNMFFKPWEMSKKRIDNFSPDINTNGIAKKRWIQNSDKTSRLIKCGSMASQQDPLNEVLVSVLAEQLAIIPVVKYDLFIEGTSMCSVCDNFITEDTDLVPAYHIYYSKPREEGESVYSHLIKMCESFDIPGAEDFINGMIFIDSLTGNEDRNLGNIGFIRDITTMKFIGPAPLFDSGNAYWNSKLINESVKSKLFGDVEADVFKKMKQKCDLSVLFKDYEYKKIISAYPCISNVKKENLINEIAKRNNRLAKAKEPDFGR